MKGMPHLAVLPNFNCATGIIIDDLHAVYEGVVNKILEIWLKEITKEQVRFLPMLILLMRDNGINEESYYYLKLLSCKSFF